MTGFVYLASPQNFRGFPAENPFESLVAMYLIAQDPTSGTVVKLPGRVSLDEGTGQITATFASPQLPFEDATFEFFGGERAPLATPARCGSYTTTAAIEPWSTPPAGTPSSPGQAHDIAAPPFAISSGPGGGACPGASLPFTPSLAAGTVNNNAGSFSELTTTL